MSFSTKERTELRAELDSVGYNWDYVDSWPAKTTLYRHRAQKNPQGEIVGDVGTSISGVPGQPSYIRNKARQGLLAWPPSESCECRWCLDLEQKLVKERGQWGLTLKQKIVRCND